MGVGLCICPRHCLVRKNGAGDLQKGERYVQFHFHCCRTQWGETGYIRYCNMDYIILSALAGVKLLRVVIMYDISCQWCKNFQRRMEGLADNLKLDPATSIEVRIPSWHINGHGENCKTFCLSYMDGVGRTYGEEVETTWAQTNALGASVREMGPGACHETLNDQWCGWNFWKIVGFHMLSSLSGSDIC
jgi:Kyakuja-Dileera-Zisupton transposase